MIKIAVVGAEGRMGRLITAAIEKDPATVVALKLDRLSGIKDLSQNNKPVAVDVIIDFSNPKATMEYLKVAKDRGIRVVIGTTGLSDHDKVEIAKIAQDIPVILSPNMSVGMNITYKLLELATRILKNRADIGLFDLHHKHKKDAPSGTALRMKEVIEKACCNTDLKDNAKKLNISNSSLRLSDAVGDHTALFALTGEQIEITHRATDRSLFAEGALEAAKWLVNQKAGLYDMQDVLGLTPYT